MFILEYALVGMRVYTNIRGSSVFRTHRDKIAQVIRKYTLIEQPQIVRQRFNRAHSIPSRCRRQAVESHLRESVCGRVCVS